MKIRLLFVVFCVFFLSCNKKSAVENKVDKIPLTLKIERFDKLFFETPPKDLFILKQKFPFFFSKSINDSVWVNKMQNPLWRSLYSEVQKKFGNITPVKQELETLFKHIKYYFPETKAPKVLTLIAQMDTENKVIYADSLLLISLEMYLGKNHKFYQFPNYIKQNLEPKQLLPDVVSSFSISKIIPSTKKDFLSQMIFSGKQLYLKELLLPNYSDADKMGYTAEQIKWCTENEGYIWRYFIDKELLYSDDPKLIPRFINPAPFSKFYLEIDNDSPGSVGAWIGWQMVRSFMKNNEIPIADLLKMDAKEIFEKSKYKPKKE